MPLRETDDPAKIASLTDVSEKFLIFYSSRDKTGKLWCPDCIAVEALIQETFGPAEGPSGLIVYVGQKQEWRSPSNPFHGEPWRVDAIPTIIRLDDDARLKEEDVLHSLASFLSATPGA